MSHLIWLVFFLFVSNPPSEQVLVLGVKDSGAPKVAKELAVLCDSIGSQITIDHAITPGQILMESYHHPDHKPQTIKALTKRKYTHIVVMDSPRAFSYPEFFFEGVYQIVKRGRKAKAKVILPIPPGIDREKQDLVYRIGKGTKAFTAPCPSVIAAVKAAGLTVPDGRCAAAAILSCITKIATPDGLLKIAEETIKKESKLKPFEKSYETLGQVHVKPLPLPRSRKVGVMSTGTSTERGWRNSFKPIAGKTKLKVSLTNLKNDDQARSFGASDLEKAGPHFKKETNRFIILFARNFSIDADTIRGAHQKHLQCQIYDKAEPLGPDMTLEAVTKRVFHSSEVIAKYETARRFKLSFIPLHVAIARVCDEHPRFVLSRDNVHMTKPFLDMLAVMCLASRTGCRMPRLSGDSKTCAEIGYQVLMQLAHLTESGKPELK